MAIKIAQTKTGTSTLASTVITWNSNTVSGNTIVVAVATNISTDVSGITDSQGNTYVNALVSNGTGVEAELWYAKNILGGATPTVTIAYTSAPTAAAVIQEYSGIDTVTTLDTASTNTGNSNSPSSGSMKNAQQLELLIGVAGGVSGTFTAGGSFVNLTQVANATINLGIEDLFITSTGSNSATFGASGSIQWACGVAGFRALPQGTTTSTSSTSISSTSTSISSTSSSTSSTSTSTSSTSTSVSTSSTSTSTSSTSSSISSTSSSTSSTSTSSTSSSTSISSTSSSVSSTSFSSTSTSSTSQSTSLSSTSSSISSTSNSTSSTSASTSSTSVSTSSTSSSTSTTTLPPPYLDYEYQDSATFNANFIKQVVDDTSSSASYNVVSEHGNTTQGNTLFAIVTSSASSSLSSMSDSRSNTWTVDIATTAGTRNVAIAHAYLAKGLTVADTITVNNSAAVSSGVIVYEFSGLLSSVVDKTNSTTGTATSLSTGSTGTLTDEQELVFTAAATGANQRFFNVPGFTELKPETQRGPDAAWTVATNGVAQNATWFWSTSAASAVAIATYYIAPSLANNFNAIQYSDVSVDDGDYFIEKGSTFLIREYKKQWTNNIDIVTFVWRGRTTLSTLISPMLIEIYNVSTTTWETLARETRVPADTDFQVKVIQSTNLSNYYDSSLIVTFRSYQRVN